MAGLPGLPPPGFASTQQSNGLPGLPPPGFAGSGPTLAQLIEDESSFVGPIASGVLRGTAALADFPEALGNFIIKNTIPIAPSDSITKFRQNVYGIDSLGDYLKKGFDYATGVPDSTQIAPKSLVGKIGEYLPGALIGPGSIASKAALGAVSGTGGYVGEQVGGPVGEIVGAVAAPLSVQAGLNQISKSLPKLGQQMERKALGTRQSDFAADANDLGLIEMPDGNLQTFTAKALDDLIAKDAFGKSAEPSEMLKSLRVEKTNLQKQIGETINAFDQSGKIATAPSWDNAMDLLSSGKIPADKVETYLNRLGEIDQAIKTNPSLRFRQNQKKGIGKLYNKDDASINEFNRAIYKDLQTNIEQAVPSVKRTNKELSKYIIADKIIKRGVAREEAAVDIEKIRDMIKTTGGFGTAILTGGLTGGPIGAGLGLGVAALGKYALSPQGMRTLGRVAKRTAPVIAQKNIIPNAVKAAVNAMANTEEDDKNIIERAMNRAEKPETPKILSAKKIAPKDIKVAEKELQPLVEAVIQQESGGNKKAVSSVGAQGLMQLMPATGRELFKKSGLPGEYDPFDPEQNVVLGTMYLRQLLREFDGDVELALTAYHSGQGRVRKLLKQTKGNSFADIQPLLGPVGQKYAPSVLRRLQKIKNSPIKV